MIARVRLSLPFVITIPIDEELPTIKHEEGGYRIKIFPPYQANIERIEIGKQANNAYWIEVNQKNLDERVRPAIALLKQGQIVAKSEKDEREYTREEWEQRQAQQHAQEETHE